MGALKKNAWTKFGGGGGWHAWEFLFNFSKVTENALITIKLLISVMLLSTALVELIVSHIFLGGGSFKECK